MNGAHGVGGAGGVDELVVVPDPSVVPTERLEADLLSWSADLAAAQARWLVWLGEYDRRGGWRAWGVVSAAHWLAWRCGVSLHAAQEKVRTARALAGLPRLTQAFCEGRVSYSKMRAVTRVATPHDEHMWLQVAEASTASQLERIVAGQQRIDDRDAGKAFWRRSVTRRGLDGGVTRITVDLPDDEAEVVWAALEQRSEVIVADAVGDGDDRAGEGETLRPPEVIAARGGRAAVRADAVVAMAGDALDADWAPSRRDRGRSLGHLHLVAELDVEAQDLSPGTVDVAVTLNGIGLCGPVGRRWMCDIDASVMLESADGTVIGETDRRRTPNRAMRRRLLRRACHRCEAPGCEATRNLHAHHVVHWSLGGPTVDGNLVMLCSFHHHLVHEGRWGIEGDPATGIVLIDPEGRAPRGERPTSDPDRITAAHRAAGFHPQPICRWDGSAPDYGFISDVLATNRRLVEPS